MGTLTRLPKSKSFRVGAVSQLTSVAPCELCYEDKYFQDGLSFFISLPGPRGLSISPLCSPLGEGGWGWVFSRKRNFLFLFQSEEDAEEVSEARP